MHAPPLADSPRDSGPARPARLLLVDDDATARETLAALLEPEAYDLQFADSGETALDRLAEPECDLVLCDVMMPTIDGLEVCRRMKAHPAWRYVPVILVTALDQTTDMIRGIDAGADEFLSKPLCGAVLRTRIRAMLRIRAQFAALQTTGGDLDALREARREALIRDAALSSRERGVLELLLAGKTFDEISTALRISPRTVRFHQGNILAKLGADSRLALFKLLA